MAEYGNMLTYVGKEQVLTDGIEASMKKLLDYNFRDAAINYGFPEGTEYTLIKHEPSKYMEFVKEDGEPYGEYEQIPEDALKVWKGKWLHTLGWYYNEDEEEL